MELLIVLAIFWIVCGLAAGWIAQQRGAEATDWFGVGLLLGPVGLFAALLSGPDTGPVCAHCGKHVAKGRTRLCNHCGYPFAG